MSRPIHGPHSGGGVDTGELVRVFGSRIHSIGHVAMMMAPWENPLYLTRVWYAGWLDRWSLPRVCFCLCGCVFPDVNCVVVMWRRLVVVMCVCV